MKRLRDTVVCADGYKVSIQASEYHYCIPRINDAEEYGACELGFPNQPDELINEYAEYAEESEYTNTVYAYVPAKVIQALLEKHGGIVSGECPPLRIEEKEGEEE